MAITKAELVSIVCDKCSFSRQESSQIVEQVFQILKETLEKGEKIKISGFGNFVIREKRPAKGKKSSDRRGSDDFREAGFDVQAQRNFAEGGESGESNSRKDRDSGVANIFGCSPPIPVF